MGARQVKQSNNPEYCPVCMLRLENRFSATSHYRAHARRGELIDRNDTVWRLPDLFLGREMWFKRGIPGKIALKNWRLPDTAKPVEQARRDWNAYLIHHPQIRDVR